MKSAIVLVATGIVALALSPWRDDVPRPNVILISVDTLRPDHLGCYGYAAGTTPSIDAFRRESIMFEQVFASAPSTLPSHASMFTTLAPQHHGASHTRGIALDSRFVTLPEVLQESGYVTAAFVGGGQLAREFGLAQGFQSYETVDDGTFEQVVARAVPFLKKARRQPFFLFLHTYEVHHPYQPSVDERASVGPAPDSVLPSYVEPPLLERINYGQMSIGKADRQQVVDLYDAEILAMDRGFRRLVADLKRLGLYDDSVIVFTSDHGEEFGEHGFMGWHSHTLYDELLRVPLLVRLPEGRHGGALVPGPARSIDVAPIILAAAGVAPPAQFGSFDLERALRRGRGADATLLLWMETPPGEAKRHGGLRTPQWKLVDGRLYDLVADPGESMDVAASHPEKLKELTSVMERMLDAREVTRGAATAPSSETLERLKSLGYLR